MTLGCTGHRETIGHFHCSPVLIVVISASIRSYCPCRRGDSEWILFGFVRQICWNPLRPFPNSLPMTLISCSFCPVMMVGTGLEWFTQPNGPLSAWTSFLSSTTQMCMFSPSWPHYITSTNLSNNLTRNDAQTPETQQLLEPPLPFLFVLVPLPSASLFPPPFFTAKL